MKNIPIDMNKFELPIFIKKDSQYLDELNRVFNEYVKAFESVYTELYRMYQ